MIGSSNARLAPRHRSRVVLRPELFREQDVPHLHEPQRGERPRPPRPSRRRPGTLDARFEAMLSSITREPANPPPIAERSRGREEMDRLTQAVESVSRELAALRALVETSLDVQFETQRAVRQELAGALSDSARAFDRGSDPVTIPGETAGSPDREESRDREGPPDADASSAAVDAAVDAVASLGLGLGLGTAVRRSFPRTEEERRRTDNDRAFHEAARAMDRRNSDPPNAGQCACCMEAAANAVFYRCGHLCCCLRCATKIHRGPERTRNCPVCRAPIVEVIRAYGATEMAGLPRERREEGREVGEGGRGGRGERSRAPGAGRRATPRAPRAPRAPRRDVRDAAPSERRRVRTRHPSVLGERSRDTIRFLRNYKRRSPERRSRASYERDMILHVGVDVVD